MTEAESRAGLQSQAPLLREAGWYGGAGREFRVPGLCVRLWALLGHAPGQRGGRKAAHTSLVTFGLWDSVPQRHLCAGDTRTKASTAGLLWWQKIGNTPCERQHRTGYGSGSSP